VCLAVLGFELRGLKLAGHLAIHPALVYFSLFFRWDLLFLPGPP
jgi:predicted membrane-bound mannosyltransferase